MRHEHARAEERKRAERRMERLESMAGDGLRDWLYSRKASRDTLWSEKRRGEGVRFICSQVAKHEGWLSRVESWSKCGWKSVAPRRIGGLAVRQGAWSARVDAD